jgi:hypothetical protein
VANPNIVNVSSIYANTALFQAGATPTTIVSNPAASNAVYKIDGLYCSNTDMTSSYLITIDVYRSSTAYNVATQITVPSGATLDILSKQLWLLEGDSLRATGNAASKITVTCSYEVIS